MNDTDNIPTVIAPARTWNAVHVLMAAICEEPGDIPPEIREKARAILDDLLDDHVPDPLCPGWVWTDKLHRAERFSNWGNADEARESMPRWPDPPHIDETPEGEWLVWTFINGQRAWVAPDLDRKLDLLQANMSKAGADLVQARRLLQDSEDRYRHACDAVAAQAAANARLTGEETAVANRNEPGDDLPTP